MVRLNRIYTRTGDDGTTGLADGSRLSKADARMAAIGDVDEANCAIGCAIEAMGDGAGNGDHAAALRRIQNDLFDLGADLATPGEDFAPSDMALRIVPEQVAWIETQIDQLNAGLQPLKSFILPGGGHGAAELHRARAIVRRAERSAIAARAAMALNPEALRYLNRLSDHLFVLARVISAAHGGDILWKPGGSR